MTDLPSIWSWHQSPIFKIIVGLLIFYVGLKMFAGGMKSLGNVGQLLPFISNPYWMFLGGIFCTLLWQSSSLSTTAMEPPEPYGSQPFSYPMVFPNPRH